LELKIMFTCVAVEKYKRKLYLQKIERNNFYVGSKLRDD
jgi:hypothetical protein